MQLALLESIYVLETYSHACYTVIVGVTYLDLQHDVMVQMYATIRGELAEGGRTFIICPLVDESSSEIMAGVKAAEEEHKSLQQADVLDGAAIGLLHGKMSSEDKFEALRAFAAGETPVLISTTVVEVCTSAHVYHCSRLVPLCSLLQLLWQTCEPVLLSTTILQVHSCTLCCH